MAYLHQSNTDKPVAYLLLSQRSVPDVGGYEDQLVPDQATVSTCITAN